MAKKKKYRLKRKIKLYLYIVFILAVALIIFNRASLSNVLQNNKLEEYKFYNTNELYIPLDSTLTLNEYKIETVDDVLSLNDKTIKANKVGDQTIKIIKDNKYQEINIHVVDIVSNYQVNKKELLKYKQYSKDEEKELEKILENQINFAGNQTRAGVVQAARFLSLEFKQKLNYFYENGRMTSNDYFDYVDGEGRYLHKGLYLSEDDYKDIKSSRQGPTMWGCPMYEETRKATVSHGIDCSGFITWAFTNAGYEVDDLGASDLFKLGTKKVFTNDDVWNEIKVGDLVGKNGHVGILAGINDNKYYIAESLDYDLHILEYTKKELLDSYLKFFILMDDYYKEEGNLTTYWN